MRSWMGASSSLGAVVIIEHDCMEMGFGVAPLLL